MSQVNPLLHSGPIGVRTARMSFRGVRLGVRVEDILSRKKLKKTRSGPVGKVRRAFDDVSKLPRRQQDKILEFLDALVNQYKSKTQAG